jgi:enoyl-CoA hydratase
MLKTRSGEYGMEEYKTLIYEPGLVTKIIHNEPDKRNILGAEFEKEFVDAIRRFDSDREAKVAVSLASGKHFTAGHDIAFLSKKQSWKPGEKVEWDEARWRSVNDTRRLDSPLWEVSKPLVAGVQGAVLAAGITFVMLHDVIVMGENAFFGTAISRVSGAFGGMWQMWLGYRKAFELLCTGWNISAQELFRAGAINKVVPDDRIEAEAMRYAEIMALMPLENLKLSKQSLKFGMNLMGAREQIWHNQETNTLVHCAATEEEKQFYTIMKEQGMKEALDFRDKPFEKYGFKRNKATDL